MRRRGALTLAGVALAGCAMIPAQPATPPHHAPVVLEECYGPLVNYGC